MAFRDAPARPAGQPRARHPFSGASTSFRKCSMAKSTGAPEGAGQLCPTSVVAMRAPPRVQVTGEGLPTRDGLALDVSPEPARPIRPAPGNRPLRPTARMQEQLPYLTCRETVPRKLRIAPRGPRFTDAAELPASPAEPPDSAGSTPSLRVQPARSLPDRPERPAGLGKRPAAPPQKCRSGTRTVSPGWIAVPLVSRTARSLASLSPRT